ncbi:MAG: hypothetical protein M1833_000401 [Piccolia ochrophora]|nr:MAG: hypothetical protein M1833_000401 [Piccolia ochrophora]
MAGYAEYLRTTNLSSDTRARDFYDDEESSILDESILDTGLDHADVFSPKHAEWAEFSENDAASTTSSGNFFRNNSHAFSYGLQKSSWASGSCTPTPAFDALPRDATSSLSGSYMNRSLSMTHASAFDIPLNNDSKLVHDFSSSTSVTTSVPTSPNKDWISPSSSEPQVEARFLPKRMRPGSPFSSAHASLLRRDGIRKKNARFEIPAERNLLNIDQLIAQSSDDQEIKELKQQKRLLRNRQAALDSRQRKKQHTERLEEEKKHYSTLISDLEDRCARMELREAEQLRQESEWKVAVQNYEQYIDGLHVEKEEMVRSHTLETGDLRKKNALLTEHIQKMESTAMSAVPSCSGFPTDFSDVDNMAMEGHPWDNFSLPYDFSMDGDSKQDDAVVVRSKKHEKLAANEEDKPAAPGLLLILLLCGAFVASKSSTSTTPNIPRMPEDIRVASATVLDNIFKDAGVSHADPGRPLASRMESTPTGSAWPDATISLSAHDMIGLTGSSLDVLNHQLVQPTKAQEREQLFSLSAEQYNGVTSQEFLREPEPSATSQGRQNLGASLAAMRTNDKASAAEVYTRSLMWDRIPKDVVRDFAKFVADSNSMSSERQSGGHEGQASLPHGH